MRRSAFALSALLFLLPACASTPTPEKEIEDCRKITDKNFRDRCIADALRDAENAAREDEVFGSENE
jgi:hypothetical protein